MHQVFRISFILFFGILLIESWSCQHSPVYSDDDFMPIDTMNVDTMNTDTTVNGVPCDPDVVYFDRDVLPILNSNCAFSGCHDAASAEDGVILDSYENVVATADVEPFNLDDSEIYEVLVDNDEDERMPPPPSDRLSQEQIQVIAKWILQGAENLDCDPDLSGCDDTDVSFSNDIQPIIATHCEGCHSGTTPSGGIDLANYNGVKTVADNGALVGAVNWSAGFENMPQGGDKLPDCEISKIVSWVNDGAPNN